MWTKIVWVGSAILFLFVAIVMLTTGQGDKLRLAYEQMVNKNRGRQDEVKDRENEVKDVISDAKEDLKDIREHGNKLEERIENRDTRNHNEIIDDFQKKYGN